MPSHLSSPQRPPVIDRGALLRVLEPVVHAHGAEVVDVEFRPERGGWVLRVFVEKAGAASQALSTRDAAVNLELCANVSRDLSPALDVVDLIPHAYQLEVSSPGVERPLKTEHDFARFTGHKARLKRQLDASGSAGDRVVVGLLDGVVEGRVRVVDGHGTHEIPLSSIESARLVFEFGSGRVDAKSRDAKTSHSKAAKASHPEPARASQSNEAGASHSTESQQRKH
jgi:ribosome maturation factor RimP